LASYISETLVPVGEILFASPFRMGMELNNMDFTEIQHTRAGKGCRKDFIQMIHAKVIAQRL
jgi:hypothetical protein